MLLSMAALIIALFVILVAWGWYLVPKKTGAHKASTLSFIGQQSKSLPSPDVTVIPVAQIEKEPGHRIYVPGVPGPGQPSLASARRRRIRGTLVTMAIVSVAAALYTGSTNWWFTHIGVDALLLIYYGLSQHLRSSGARVSRPPAYAGAGESEPILRRVAGG